jgi:cytochrome b pre-mRNA-processing protein 3
MLSIYKNHHNLLYNKLVELSRNIFFYEKILLKDNFETRINLIFTHMSLILIIFREKKIKFPQEIFDNIFLSVEYHIREIGYGDVVVNKKMKTLTRIFYDILLKIKSSQNQVFIINNNVLKTYFDVQSNKSDQLVDKLAMYFKDFYYYCFELDNNIVLKGQINFNYTNKNGRT